MTNLRKMIIHQLVKNQHEEIRESRIANDLLATNIEKVQDFANKIVAIYGKRQNSAQYGIFSSIDELSSFGYKAEEYTNGIEERSDLEFKSLTEFIMEKLETEASRSAPASGGYIVFLEYETDGQIFLMVAMVKKTDGMNIDEELHIESLQYIDLSKLTQALRINSRKFREYIGANDIERAEMTYLSFVSPRTSSTTAGYFVTALGCDKGPSSAKATTYLFTASNNFFSSHELLTNRAPEMHIALLSHVVRCSENGENIKLSGVENVARQFIPADDQEEFEAIIEEYLTFLNNEDNRVPVEFPPNKKVTDSYTHVSFKDANYQISISRNLVSRDEHAAVCLTNDGKVIFNRPPQELIDTLEQALNGTN